MLLKLARAAFNRGWIPVYEFFFDLDMWWSGLRGASRRIKRDQDARRDHPFGGVPTIEGRRP